VQALVATLASTAAGCAAMVPLENLQVGGMRGQRAVSNFSRGTRAALAASTASCTMVPLWTHLITGPVASIVSGWIDDLMARFALHDHASIISVHLTGGAVGVLSVGFFADPVRPLIVLAPCLHASLIT
jgi:ammonia channel protein AmtB